MVIEGRAEVGGNFLCGVATDEQNTDNAIDQLAQTVEYAIAHRYTAGEFSGRWRHENLP